LSALQTTSEITAPGIGSPVVLETTVRITGIFWSIFISAVVGFDIVFIFSKFSNYMIPKFKYHNILVNGVETVPGMPFYNDSLQCQNITHFLCFRYLHKDRSKIRIADLGPLEGGHAWELIKYGFTVTCIEGREENCAKLQWLEGQMTKHEADRMAVIHDDAWNIAKYGPFDVVLCSGLLYHLDRPVAFLKLISEEAKDVLILSTHYAEYPDRRYEVHPIVNWIKRRVYKRAPFLFKKRYFGLSRFEMNEGYTGRWLKEFKPTEKTEKINTLLASSLNNHRSFWLSKPVLEHCLRNTGFNFLNPLDNKKDALVLYIATKAR
jgi:2-polyprenyl-3-methyl-5-hydroxy-6-metoxy-1,4-benzoquinol methylase